MKINWSAVSIGMTLLGGVIEIVKAVVDAKENDTRIREIVREETVNEHGKEKHS